MPSVYKVLGQNSPSANTVTTLYTVPSGNSAVISTLTICNQGTANIAANVNICVGNAAVSAANRVVHQTTVVANDTVFLTLGLTLAATDTIRVSANAANVSFNVFGSENY